MRCWQQLKMATPKVCRSYFIRTSVLNNKIDFADKQEETYRQYLWHHVIMP